MSSHFGNFGGTIAAYLAQVNLPFGLLAADLEELVGDIVVVFDD